MVKHSKDTDKLSEKERRIFSYLDSNPVGVLATVEPDGKPHAAVIYFSVDRHFNIFFVTKTGTRKHSNMQHNAAAMLVAFDKETQTTVQVTGTAKQLNSVTESQKVFEDILKASLQTSIEGVPPIAKLHAGYYAAYRLTPTQIRMAVFARPDAGDYDRIFETIEAHELDRPA